jgi:hypothetical protein
MKSISILMVLTVVLAVTALASGRQSVVTLPDVKATPAYEMLIVRRAAIRAELVEQKETLTSHHPDVERTRYEFSLLDIEIEKMLASERSQISKLSRVYGHLILRKIDLQVGEHDLRNQLTLTHPDLKKNRLELDAIQQEIDDLLR